MREMKDPSTDIIVVSNELFCKEEIAKEFDKYISRGCNIIEVTSLQPINIMQRIVYTLLEKNSFAVKDADHIVFTLLSKYSQGAATIIHMLATMMQKSEDNSRIGFELAKQQLKLHIAHQKSEKFYQAQNIWKETMCNVKVQDCGKNIMTERQSQTTDTTFEIALFLSSMQVVTNNSGGNEVSAQVTAESEVDRATQLHSIIRGTANFVTDNDDNEQAAISDATQLLVIAKADGQHIPSLNHPLYMYINDILFSTTSNISLPAYQLLNSLVITGPIPLPLFYVEGLNNVIMNAVTCKEKDELYEFAFELPIKQLLKVGVIRNACYPIVYHKELNPENINSSIQQLMVIPKLICDADKVQMDDTDKLLSILCIQRALENLLTSDDKPSLIHLQYIFILCNRLDDVCTPELHQFGGGLLTSNFKLKFLISQKSRF